MQILLRMSRAGQAFCLSNNLPRQFKVNHLRCKGQGLVFKPLTHVIIPQVQGLGGKLGFCAEVGIPAP